MIEQPLHVVICGGGNAAHTAAICCTQAAPAVDVAVLAIYEDEAERWTRALQEVDGMMMLEDVAQGTKRYGRVRCVSKNAEDVVSKETQLVLLAVPSVAHHSYLKQIAPMLNDKVIIAAMPGGGGFLPCVYDALGVDVRLGAIAALMTLPWACRIIDFGQSVRVLGTKQSVDLTIQLHSTPNYDDVRGVLQVLIGKEPVLIVDPKASFLACDLLGTWHPTITYGAFHTWDGTTPFREKPLFYSGVDEPTAQLLLEISDEIQSLRRVFEQKYPELDLISVCRADEWLAISYGDTIPDRSSFRTMLQTNPAYQGLTHPMRPSPNDTTGWVPDYTHRYMTEDVPDGMVVIRGIAELAGVAMPQLDRVLLWCQTQLGKQYLVNGKLQGEHVRESRAPQRFGFSDLETYLRANRFIS